MVVYKLTLTNQLRVCTVDDLIYGFQIAKVFFFALKAQQKAPTLKPKLSLLVNILSLVVLRDVFLSMVTFIQQYSFIESFNIFKEI